MQLSSVLIKTAKGLEEIDKRTYKLSGRLRAVMFMIDGQRNVEQLLEQAGSLASQLEEQLQELIDQGFIEAIAPDVNEVSEPVPAIATPQPPPRPAPQAAQPAQAAKPAPAPAAKPLAPAPSAVASNSTQLTPIPIVKARLSKMLAETMGMRAMFIVNQLESITTIKEIANFIDETAKSHATSAGAKAAEQWRTNARQIAGL
jgi:DNA-binding FrmR family transcriptional regulator